MFDHLTVMPLKTIPLTWSFSAEARVSGLKHGSLEIHLHVTVVELYYVC